MSRNMHEYGHLIDLADMRARIIAGSEPEPNTGCWLWTGHISADGYGYTGTGPKACGSQPTHRVSLLAFRGILPPRGMHLDHLCRQRSCCNPDHLEVVTPAENMRRGESRPARQARQTHCKYGHEFTPENTWRAGDGSRKCRACFARQSDNPQVRERERQRKRAYMREYYPKYYADHRAGTLGAEMHWKDGRVTVGRPVQ